MSYQEGPTLTYTFLSLIFDSIQRKVLITFSYKFFTKILFDRNSICGFGFFLLS